MSNRDTSTRPVYDIRSRALRSAIRQGNYIQTVMLSKNYPHINSCNHLALRLAAQSNNYYIIDHLVHIGADIMGAIMYCIKCGMTKACTNLISYSNQ